MAKENRKWLYILGLTAFVIYIFIAPRSIPVETVLAPRWITSLESNYPINFSNTSADDNNLLLPFTLGDRFGYLADGGKFSINQIMDGYVSMSENLWAEYEALPSSIKIMDPHNEEIFVIDDPKGYPFFLDNRVFIVGSEQNSITALSQTGEKLWTHDFPAPLTCVDAAGGFLLAGTLDGVVELLDFKGSLVFTPFEPGGSRFSVILGCAISQDASRLAIISGVEQQRFLLLERSGTERSRTESSRTEGSKTEGNRTEGSNDTYKVVHHEFLSDGFRRPVFIRFIDDDAQIIFEREEGLGIFTISSRTSTKVKLEGEITALDDSGENGFLFLITSQGQNEKRFIAIRHPGLIVNETPFKSKSAFLARKRDRIYLGGDLLMASFEMEKN
jgi:hypothetical protein